MSSWTPEQDAAMAAETAAMAKALDAKKAPEKSDKAVPATPDPADKVQEQTPSGVVSDAKAAPDKAKAPETVEAADLSFLPEALRSKVRVENVEAAAALKSGWMAHSEATKRFTEAKALERDAANYRDLVADPEIASMVTKAIMDKREGRKPSAPVTPEEPEFDPLDPKSVAAFVNKTAEAKIAAEKAKMIEEQGRPAALRNQVLSSLEAYRLDNAIESSVFGEAVKMADAALVKQGRTWNPELVSVLMEPYVAVARSRVAAPAPANKTETKSAASGMSEVASPTGLGGPHTANVIPLPSHYVNGKPKPGERTNSELEEEMLYAMRKRFGPGVTIEDVRAGVR